MSKIYGADGFARCRAVQAAVPASARAGEGSELSRGMQSPDS